MITVLPPPNQLVNPELRVLSSKWLTERKHLNKVVRIGEGKEKRLLAILASIIGLGGELGISV